MGKLWSIFIGNPDKPQKDRKTALSNRLNLNNCVILFQGPMKDPVLHQYIVFLLESLSIHLNLKLYNIICSWINCKMILQNIKHKRPCEVTTWTSLFTLSKLREVIIIQNEGFEFTFLPCHSENSKYKMYWGWKLWWDWRRILRRVLQKSLKKISRDLVGLRTLLTQYENISILWAIQYGL